ncbi:MAG: PEP-CTERM sorting domain-containing protein [Paludisphaera borealis]|uniref:PEP-CTERM sorting domain-containing protein n=1 Tax=Paludisphaera borealis TaxID=1387353 RepID=UPI00284637F7|nr:PEP-CTERM sorting domain-containing protein [Paludisphaera borealis]MDR3622454.1 PEP-CTERM sorting domain-containing protein [Paludisphaera borealis]
MRQVTVLAALALVFVAPSAQAGLDGANMNAVYYYPNLASPYGNAIFSPSSFFTVGAGTETTGVIDGVTTLSVDFTDTTLTILLSTTLTNPTWGDGDFNGPLFTLLSSGTLGITGATIDPGTNLAGFDASRVTFSDTQIGINWEGLPYTTGDKVVIDFSFASAPVPEPSSLIAMASGCAALPLLVLRRRRRAA